MGAYSVAYLDEIVETQGLLFDVANETFGSTLDTLDFITRNMLSKTRARIDRADPYVCTKDAYELLEWLVQTEDFVPNAGEQIGGFIPNWIGQFYAYFQWYYSISSVELVKILPPANLVRMYFGLQDLDLELAVTKVWDNLGAAAKAQVSH